MDIEQIANGFEHCKIVMKPIKSQFGKVLYYKIIYHNGQQIRFRVSFTDGNIVQNSDGSIILKCKISNFDNRFILSIGANIGKIFQEITNMDIVKCSEEANEYSILTIRLNDETGFGILKSKETLKIKEVPLSGIVFLRNFCGSVIVSLPGIILEDSTDVLEVCLSKANNKYGHLVARADDILVVPKGRNNPHFTDNFLNSLK